MMYLIPWFSYALPVLAELSFSTLAQLGHLGTRSWIKMIKVCNICKRIWIYIYMVLYYYIWMARALSLTMILIRGFGWRKTCSFLASIWQHRPRRILLLSCCSYRCQSLGLSISPWVSPLRCNICPQSWDVGFLFHLISHVAHIQNISTYHLKHHPLR